MKRLLIISFILMAAIFGIASPAQAGNTPVHHSSHSQQMAFPPAWTGKRITSSCTFANFCGFLNDDFGSGYAASPKPGQGNLGDGIFAIGDDQGAWRVQEYTSTFCGSSGDVTDTCPYTGNGYPQNAFQEGNVILVLCLYANPNACYKDNSNTLDLASYNGNARDQMWVYKGGYLFNVSATDADPNGNPQPMSNFGGGAQLGTCNLSCVSQSHQSWSLGDTTPK